MNIGSRIGRLKGWAMLAATLYLVGCSPAGLYMKGGEDIDKMIKSGKITFAVLPTVDWSEDPGFCKGYMQYGCAGAISRQPVYQDASYQVTNSLIGALWKKNRVLLVRKNVLVEKLASAKLTRQEIFPKQNYKGFCQGWFPAPITGPNAVGQGEPAYEKLYAFGASVGADVVVISRITTNISAAYLPQNPLGAFPPFTTAVSVAVYVYKGVIKKYREDFIGIDIMALDVKKRQVIAFGGYSRLDEHGVADREPALERYTKATTFYMPMPAKEDLQKSFAAAAASVATTMIANYIVQQAGITLSLAFNFTYEYDDETWKLQPPDFFMNNYGLTKDEFAKVAP